MFSLLFTYLGKIDWYIDQLIKTKAVPGRSEMAFLAYIADDLLFYGGFILLIWTAEFVLRRRWFSVATTVLMIPFAIVATSNLFWLRGTGGQLSASVIRVGLSRWAEVQPVLQKGLGLSGILLLIIGLCFLAFFPILFQLKWKKDGRPPQERPLIGLAVPLLILLVGVAGKIEQNTSRSSARAGWRLIADNVFVAMAVELHNEPTLKPAPVKAPDPSPGSLSESPGGATRPNIVLFLMEATAHRATSFAPGMERQTPILAQLAADGLTATRMRSVLPHTTKSVFSMLCGRYPATQHQILETADNYGMHCLPDILKRNGYATAFFQSADGRFEDRPRLVKNMGFDHFEARQDLRPPIQPLGYLAGDDAGLVKPVLQWADQQKQPFFITVLTSSTHHTYDLPDRILRMDGMADAQKLPFPSKYLILVKDLDTVLNQLLDGLAVQQQAKDLLVIAAGDHGEAFGEHGGYQHDNIFWEEGLHVPFVMWSPGRIQRQVVDEVRSLMDVAPSVLDAVDIPFVAQRFDGRTILKKETRPVRRYFSCWYSNVCVGYVEGQTKLVYLPSVRSWLVYDLDRDPLEQNPLVDPPEWKERAMATRDWYNAHRYSFGTLRWDHRMLFNDTWDCGAGVLPCRSRR